MTFKELNLKHCYDSDEDDILDEFYIPVLEKSKKYLRLAGYFRSSSLAVSARGILGLLKNNGKMLLIAGAVLSEQDVKAIKEGLENSNSIIEKSMIKELNEIKDEFIRDHVKALSWMVANQKLEIKIAIVTDDSGNPIDSETVHQRGIFHQKIGVFEDSEGQKISFSGSVNESATAWKNNIEDFNVFREWIDAEKPYLEADIKRFNKFWLGETKRTKIIDVPTAIREKFIKLAPSNIKSLNLNKWNKRDKNPKKKILLRPYQNDAIRNWLNNNKQGIFEMATGTGKTFTALGCINEITKQDNKIIVIISCPYQHLIQQWKNEIEKFGIHINIIIADSSNRRWKNDLSDTLIDISLGYKEKIIILTTHSTLRSNDFIDIIEQNKNIDICLVGDEVHGLGADMSQKGLADYYNMRLGLSATPKRWFDDIGTEKIFKYFGESVYVFDLWKAINTVNPFTGTTFLTPYRYIPKFISLDSEELIDYQIKTKSIIKMYEKAKKDIEKEEILQRLLFQRANIIKNAKQKYQVLEDFLNEQGQNVEHTIIYCSPQQIDNVMDILDNHRIITHKFTMEEGTKAIEKYYGLTEREFILKNFAEGKYKTLVAMKCLDEGVDVPPARKAILLASSGNPREYIQRIGRVIRRYPKKEEALIYDLIVVPSFKTLSTALRLIEWEIFKKEINRYEELAKNALNNAEALKLIYEIKNTIR